MTVNQIESERAAAVISRIENLIASLQLLVSFLKTANPSLVNKLSVWSFTLTAHIYGREKEQKSEFSKLARSLAKGINKLPKEYSDYACSVTREFGGMVKLHLSISREAVCERVVKETIEHPAHTVEAYTEEVVEWKCK